MASIALQLVSNAAEGCVGFQVGPETYWMDVSEARQQLRDAIVRSQSSDYTRTQIFDAIVRRFRDDGIDPRSATFAQLKTSVERAPLGV